MLMIDHRSQNMFEYVLNVLVCLKVALATRVHGIQKEGPRKEAPRHDDEVFGKIEPNSHRF